MGEDRNGRFRGMRGMLRVTFCGVCPSCHRTSAFRSAYALHELCPACGVRFERDPGSFLGVLALAYGVAIVALGGFTLATVPRWGLFEGFAFALGAVGVVTVLLVYRPAKAWWLWWLWAAGFVTRDGERRSSRS